jgi:hypothetical protein
MSIKIENIMETNRNDEQQHKKHKKLRKNIQKKRKLKKESKDKRKERKKKLLSNSRTLKKIHFYVEEIQKMKSKSRSIEED